MGEVGAAIAMEEVRSIMAVVSFMVDLWGLVDGFVFWRREEY